MGIPVKFLLDNNLSPKLVSIFTDDTTIHVKDIDMDNSSDHDIWQYCKTHGHIIITLDNDFVDLAEINGAPPKVVLITGGNFKRQEISEFLTLNYSVMKTFAEDSESALLILDKNRI